MKTNRKVPTRFEPDTRFDLKPVGDPFRVAHESRFESLKTRLLNDHLEGNAKPEFISDVRRAANEAAALAWITAYPLLVFPSLFEEKAAVATARAARQETIRERSRELLAA